MNDLKLTEIVANITTTFLELIFIIAIFYIVFLLITEIPKLRKRITQK